MFTCKATWAPTWRVPGLWTRTKIWSSRGLCRQFLRKIGWLCHTIVYLYLRAIITRGLENGDSKPVLRLEPDTPTPMMHRIELWWSYQRNWHSMWADISEFDTVVSLPCRLRLVQALVHPLFEGPFEEELTIICMLPRTCRISWDVQSVISFCYVSDLMIRRIMFARPEYKLVQTYDDCLSCPHSFPAWMLQSSAQHCWQLFAPALSLKS